MEDCEAIDSKLQMKTVKTLFLCYNQEKRNRNRSKSKMFREMRRKKQQLTTEECVEILKQEPRKPALYNAIRP